MRAAACGTSRRLLGSCPSPRSELPMSLPRRSCLLLLPLVVIAALPVPAAAQGTMYRCIDKGVTVFSDKPCPGMPQAMPLPEPGGPKAAAKSAHQPPHPRRHRRSGPRPREPPLPPPPARRRRPRPSRRDPPQARPPPADWAMPRASSAAPKAAARPATRSPACRTMPRPAPAAAASAAAAGTRRRGGARRTAARTTWARPRSSACWC
jgi:hypothetical protein